MRKHLNFFRVEMAIIFFLAASFLRLEHAFACSLSSESSWHWPIKTLAKKSNWIAEVKILKDTKDLINKKTNYSFRVVSILKDQKEQHKIMLEFNTTSSNDDKIVYYDLACDLILNLKAGEKYIIFSEHFNPNSFIRSSKKNLHKIKQTISQQ